MSDYEQAARDLKAATDEVKRFAEASTTELRNLGKVTEETRASADKALAEMNGLSARLADIEQKAARHSGNPMNAVQSLGEEFMASDAARELKSSFQGRVRSEMERKALTTGPATMGTTTSAGTSLIPTMRLPGIDLVRLPKPTLRSLIPSGATSSPIIEFVRQKSFTNKAATVAEGAKKPYSDMTFELDRANVAVIAHLFKVSKQALDDAPELTSIINSQGVAGLEQVEEYQFMYGDGVGANILGLMEQATDFAAPAGLTPPDSALDTIRMAMLQASLSLYPATGIVLNEIDWFRITSVKDEIGRYVLGDPQSVATHTLWGLPVVISNTIRQGDFLVGAFATGAQIFDRQSVAIEVAVNNGTDFEDNMASIRIEERTGLVVYRQQSFITGTLPPDATAAKKS
nr:phage major capsid protein [Asaia lannensis]